jgi:putative hydrolase of the HAD superfamily
MTRVEAVVSDFGGVLTTPLLGAFAAFQDHSGVPFEVLGKALSRVGKEDGEHPLYRLERGEITEEVFLNRLADGLRAEVGRDVELHSFSERYFAHLHPNDELFAYYRGLHDRGVRLAMLTNNVREWEPKWRPMLPIDEIFELVVDSAFVGMRKPEHRIFELTLSKLGLAAEACVFVDDLEPNIVAARELGFQVVHFRDTAQAIAEIDAALTD